MSIYRFPAKEEELDRGPSECYQEESRYSKYGRLPKSLALRASDARMKKAFGREIPMDPPSIFARVHRSHFRRTVAVSSRGIEERKVSSTSRTEIPDELPIFEQQDKLPSDFDDFAEEIMQKHFGDFRIFKTESSVRLVTFEPTFLDVNVLITINFDFSVAAYRRKTKVSFHALRDVPGFQMKLTRWSQLDVIMNHAKNYPLSEELEVAGNLERLQETLKVMDIDLSKYEFIFEQAILLTKCIENRRYSSMMTKQALRMFLFSRSAYRYMRSILCLPHPSTLIKGLGITVNMGSESIAANVCSLYFSNVTSLQKCCILLFDEVYVKPSVRYRSGHVVGYAADEPD